MLAKIRYWNTERGYGFLITNDGKDLFFHRSEILDFARIEKYQMVSYWPGEFNGRPVATQVRAIIAAAAVGNAVGAPAVVGSVSNERN